MNYRIPIATILATAAVLHASGAWAAPPWVGRRLTLPERQWAFDLGAGVAHRDHGLRSSIPDDIGSPVEADRGFTTGFHLEAAWAPIPRLELGLRTGVRLNQPRVEQADNYGRLFDRQTFGTRGGILAMPEFRVRGQLVDAGVFELALEGRALFDPFDTSLMVMPGVPISLHVGQIARIDAGFFLPVHFDDTSRVGFSIPLDVWFQATPRFWLGPMANLGHRTRSNRDGLLAGVGLGYQAASFIDIKAQVYWPEVDKWTTTTAGGHEYGPANFGVGAGVQIRLE